MTATLTRVSMHYPGYITTGRSGSSSAEAADTGLWTRTTQAYFSGASDNFRTHLDCLHNWYEQGWLMRSSRPVPATPSIW